MKQRIQNVSPKTYNGINYKSTLEARIAKIFTLLHIPFEYEPTKFILQDSFSFIDETVRQITYTPDFKFGTVFVECKGFATPEWNIKKKMFQKYLVDRNYPYKFYQIKSEADCFNVIDENMETIKYLIVVEDLKGNFVGKFDSVKDAFYNLGLQGKRVSNVFGCLCGIRKSAFNYVWKWEKSVFTPLEGEEWRTVESLDNKYAVSSFGRVASVQFHGKENFKLLSQSDVRGYKKVKIRLWDKGFVQSYFVHRLVAEAFIPNPENKPCVDHIDTNPSNNNVANLRWVTVLENQRNPITLKRVSDSITAYNKSGQHKEDVTKTLGREVIQWDLDGNFIAEYPSMCVAAKAVHTTAACIKRVCDSQRTKHKKWVFTYKN